MLIKAERPILMMGGGVMLARASQQFVELAEYLQIPVIPTYMAEGGIAFNHPLYGGRVGLQTNTRAGNKLFLESDVVLSIGNRFAERHTGDLAVYRGERKFIHIDIEPTVIGKVFPADLGIVADAKLALEALTRVAKEMTPKRSPSEWSKKAADYKRRFRRKMDYDQVPLKHSESSRRSTSSSTTTPFSSRPSASTRSGRASSRRSKNRIRTSAAARPAR
jgi:tartronate-semialdehyde synthase